MVKRVTRLFKRIGHVLRGISTVVREEVDDYYFFKAETDSKNNKRIDDLVARHQQKIDGSLCQERDILDD